jgi:hypothetical protein
MHAHVTITSGREKGRVARIDNQATERERSVLITGLGRVARDRNEGARRDAILTRGVMS